MFSVYLYMLIFIKKKVILNQVTGPVSVPKFRYPNSDPVFIRFKNLEPVPDPILPISGLDPPGPNRVRIRNRVPDFFCSILLQIWTTYLSNLKITGSLFCFLFPTRSTRYSHFPSLWLAKYLPNSSTHGTFDLEHYPIIRCGCWCQWQTQCNFSYVSISRVGRSWSTMAQPAARLGAIMSSNGGFKLQSSRDGDKALKQKVERRSFTKSKISSQNPSKIL